MQIEFFFDPSCPWCWITSRWLSEVRPQRQLDIRWRPFSLALKNYELDPATESSVHTEHASAHQTAHSLQRIVAATQRNYPARVGAIYTALGKRWHLEGQHTTDIVPEALAEAGLPAELAGAVAEAEWDTHLQHELDDAIAAAGDDVGVPLIVFVTPKGRQGYFGPVLRALPPIEQGLQLWDGLASLAVFPEFYELKRSRSGRPKVDTTKRSV